MVQKQLAEFDKITAQRKEQATKDCLPGIEVKQAHARLAMRERQLKELAEAMRDLSPEEVGSLICGYQVKQAHTRLHMGAVRDGREAVWGRGGMG